MPTTFVFFVAVAEGGGEVLKVANISLDGLEDPPSEVVGADSMPKLSMSWRTRNVILVRWCSLNKRNGD